MLQRQVSQPRGVEGEIIRIFHQGGEQTSGESGGVADRLIMAARVGPLESPCAMAKTSFGDGPKLTRKLLPVRKVVFNGP